jgi:sigma-B regulation protein RsbU (phosphoserine phosphatase)
LHLSKRVLETVRATGKAVCASSQRDSNAKLALTVIDEHRPRAVACALITEMSETMDALYLDTPSTKDPAEMLGFVRVAARQVGLARKNLLLAEAKAEHMAIDQQLAMARSIQAKLTPQVLPSLPGIDLALFYRPAMWVGGDYCDIWQLPDGRLAFAVGDVSGKGLPGAIVMANLQAALRAIMSFCPNPAEVIEHLNQHLKQNLPEGMFVSLFLGLIDPHDGRMEYVNAGHVPPFVIHDRKQVTMLDEMANPLLGVPGLEGPFLTTERPLNPGDCLVIVTDGITEAVSPTGEMYGMGGLQRLLQTTPINTAEEAVQSITKATEEFRHLLLQQDDVTVFALLYRGAN